MKTVALVLALGVLSAPLFGGFTVSAGSATARGTDLRDSILAFVASNPSNSDWRSVLGVSGIYGDSAPGSTFTTIGGHTYESSVAVDDSGLDIGTSVLNLEYLYADSAEESGFVMTVGGETELFNTYDPANSPKAIAHDGIGSSVVDFQFHNYELYLGFIPNTEKYDLDAKRVITFTDVETGAEHFVWFFDDDYSNPFKVDFNDMIVFGSVLAIPEPSTIIGLLAFAFLGLTAWRQSRRSRK